MNLSEFPSKTFNRFNWNKIQDFCGNAKYVIGLFNRYGKFEVILVNYDTFEKYNDLIAENSDSNLVYDNNNLYSILNLHTNG